jgi:hypothetical protein
MGNANDMSITHTKPDSRVATDAERPAQVGGLIGLAARGVLYLVLAFLALDLVIGRQNDSEVDTRGAMEELARSGFGKVLLVILAIGFAAFALWFAYEALVRRGGRRDTSDRIADGARAVVYGLMSALAISFVVSARGDSNTDQREQTWTAKVLDWPAGPVIVGVIGLVVLATGLFLLWRAFTGDRQDSKAVEEAAPRETQAVHTLGRVGNVARGSVVALIGVFVIAAAIDHDPDDTAGVDGSLKRLIDQPYGEVLVVLVALGLAAFAIYSLARAAVNRRAALL